MNAAREFACITSRFVARNSLARFALALGTVIASTSCSSGKRYVAPTTSDSAGVALVTLPVDPSVFVDSSSSMLVAQPEINLEERFEIAYANDVALNSQLTPVILDRVRAEVVSASTPRTLVARNGKGPGEFTSPIALEIVGDRAIVLEPMDTRTLTSISLVDVKDLPLSKDLDGQFGFVRRVGPQTYFSLGAGEGFEDPSRRMRRIDDSSFAIELRPATNSEAMGILLRMTNQLQVVDTIARFRVVPIPTPSSRGGFEDSVHIERTLWAVGADWHAVHERNSNRIDIVSGGKLMSSVRWRGAPVPIDETEKIATVRWLGDYTVRQSTEAANAVAHMSAKEVNEQYATFAHQLVFAGRRPSVAGMFAAGNCLLFAGWSADDARDGTAVRWHVFNVKNTKLVGDFVVPQKDSRIREYRNGVLYFTRINSANQSLLDGYAVACAG